jgi:signal transduction histidine kinase/ActR/RegA family two-component response regulator
MALDRFEGTSASLRPDLLASREIDGGVQRRLFVLSACLILILSLTYGVAHASQGRYDFAVLKAAGFGFTAACWWWASRTGRYARPMIALGLVVFAVLAWHALHQGRDLPAAGWWLSIVPFILAGAGLYRLAIGAVLGFIGVVTWLYFGPATMALEPVSFVGPWRRYTAVVGSELLALSLIILAMRGRAQVARVLQAARQAAVEAAAVKTRFLSTMSHEIRTPLNGIIGAAELLDSPRLTSEQRLQLVALQRQSANTLLALVNDVLDFAKLESGKLTLESQPVFLRSILMEANQLFSTQAFGKGIELSSSCDDDVPQSFLGDLTRLRQIVNNLVGNAVKFTSKGGVHIHLSLAVGEPAAADGKQWVRIEVVDSGPGIAEDRLDQLFMAFTQADDSVTRQFGGSGLGLTIAQELARLMGGRIEVRTRLGQGSSFCLVVPLIVASQVPASDVAGRRRDVLLATANPDLERHVKSLLHELNVEPVTLERLPTDAELKPCSLLLIDAPLLHLPDAGAWLARQRDAQRRIAVLTPLHASAIVAAASQALLVYKPVRREALEAVLGTPGSPALAPTNEREPETNAPARGLRVLVVEDNPVNQVVVQAMLAELGATSVIAQDGRQGLACALGEPFDLVLMDVDMPGMDGLSVTRELRKDEARLHRMPVRIVAMTASAESEEGAACRSAGMDGFLAKPFDLARLRTCLVEQAPRSQRTA